MQNLSEFDTGKTLDIKEKDNILYKTIHTYKKLNRKVCHMQRGE